MGGIKNTETFELNEGHVAWLAEMAKKHDLESRDKALRVLIDYAMAEGDESRIFDEVRCHHC